MTNRIMELADRYTNAVLGVLDTTGQSMFARAALQAEVSRVEAELAAAQADAAQLLKALIEAATSLSTIGRLAGRAAYLGDDGERIPTYMEHHDEVRGFANSRASVARAAIDAMTKIRSIEL